MVGDRASSKLEIALKIRLMMISFLRPNLSARAPPTTLPPTLVKENNAKRIPTSVIPTPNFCVMNNAKNG